MKMNLNIAFIGLFASLFCDIGKCAVAREASGQLENNHNYQSKIKDDDHSDHQYINWKLDEILKEVRHPYAKETDGTLLQKFEQLEKRMEDALNDIRNDISAHTNSMNDIKNDISAHTNGLNEIRNDISAHTNSLNEIKNDISVHTNGLNEIKNDISAHTNGLNEIKNDISVHTNGLNEIKNDIIVHTNSLNEIKNDISVHTNSLNEMKQELNANKQYSTTKYHELRLDVDENFLDANTKHRELRQELKESLGENIKISGTTYTRWGRTVCPGNGSEAVYSGYTGGSHYTHTGAAASMLCLPEDPDWEQGKYSNKQDAHIAYIYGTEYEDLSGGRETLFGRSHYQQDVPCVVCNVKSRTAHIVIPGRTRCYPGWTREYSGYLMAGRYNQPAATDYYCIDKDPEDIPGGTSNQNGYLLYFVEAVCGSLSCPPYTNGREFRCVVCSK